MHTHARQAEARHMTREAATKLVQASPAKKRTRGTRAGKSRFA